MGWEWDSSASIFVSKTVRVIFSHTLPPPHPPFYFSILPIHGFAVLICLFSYKWSVYLQVGKTLCIIIRYFYKGMRRIRRGGGRSFVVVVVVLFWGGLYFCISSLPENLSELVRCLFVGLFCKLCRLGTKQPWVCLFVCLSVCLFVFFLVRELSQLLMEGWKFLPLLGTHGHWAVRGFCLGIVVPLENFSII